MGVPLLQTSVQNDLEIKDTNSYLDFFSWPPPKALGYFSLLHKLATQHIHRNFAPEEPACFSGQVEPQP